MDLHNIFPYSNLEGGSTQGLKTHLMQQISKKAQPLSVDAFQTIVAAHHLFLRSGGAGGKWQTLSLSGLILAIYTEAKGEEGKQANFEQTHIPTSLDLQELLLPFSNFCGVFCKNQDFSEADLTGSLMTDAYLVQTIFADANLKNVDFSRANLRKASFMNANLKGADFENADLTGADFRGAILDGSRFPGAILKDVKY